MTACDKIAYDSFSEAQSVVNQAGNRGRTSNRHRATKKPKRVYKCECCGRFHLTSKVKVNRKPVPKKNKTSTEDVKHFTYGKPEHKDKTLNIKSKN